MIASTHRALAVVEKQAPGDGVGDPDGRFARDGVRGETAHRFRHGSAGEGERQRHLGDDVRRARGGGALPFPREAFEAAIRAGGTGVEASLRAFGAAFDRDQRQARRAGPPQCPRSASSHWPDATGTQELDDHRRAHSRLSRARATDARCRGAQARRLSRSGLCARISRSDRRALRSRSRARRRRREGCAFTIAAAKYVAAAMAYDDVPRVADLKIRASRQARVRREVGAAADVARLDHGIFPSARRRALRLAAEGLGRVDRGPAHGLVGSAAARSSIAAGASARTRSRAI